MYSVYQFFRYVWELSVHRCAKRLDVIRLTLLFEAPLPKPFDAPEDSRGKNEQDEDANPHMLQFYS